MASPGLVGMAASGPISQNLHSPAEPALPAELEELMDIEVDTRGGPTTGPYFEDAEGFNMPLAPGTSNRRIPRGEFPTGPAVGELLPDIGTPDHTGRTVDVHADRAGQPAVVVFYRSAVW